MTVGIALLGLGCALLAGCTKEAPVRQTDTLTADAEAPTWPASCTALIDACHKKDDGTPGTVHDCHSAGHSGDGDECTRVDTELNCQVACGGAPLVGRYAVDAAPDGLDAGTDTGDAPISTTDPVVCDELVAMCGGLDGATPAACASAGREGDEATCKAQSVSCRSACGALLCITIGQLCHTVGDLGGRYAECHDVGHSSDTDACIGASDCLELCSTALSDAGR